MKKVYLFATIMAILTAIAVYFFASAIQENSKKSNIQTKPVVVAAVDIKENTLITDKMLTVKELPYNSVTQGAASNISEVINKVTKYPILSGEQLILNKLVQTEDEKAGELAFMLPQGHRAITINVDEMTGVAGYINKGDYVDLISTLPKDGKPWSVIVVEKVKVLKLGNYTADIAGDVNQYANITLSVSTIDAIAINHVINSGGIIRVLLRPTLDKKPSGLPTFKS